MTDLVEATLQQQSKDQEAVSSLGMKKHQEFLAHLQAGIRRIFGQLRSLFFSQMFWCFPVFCWRFLVKKIHCKKKRWLRFIRRPWFGFSATEKRKHVSISPTVESMLKLLDSFLDGFPRKPKVWCNFSPLAGLETRICQQNKAKWKYGNFKHAGLKKGECSRIQVRDMKKYSGHFWTTFFWWTVLWSPSPTPCWLCNCQDHLQSSFAQVLGEIRSQSSLAHLLCSSGVPAMWKGFSTAR